MKVNLNKIFILLLFYIAPLVDSLTGYLVLSNFMSEGAGGSPSQIFRLFILVIMAFILTGNRRYFYGAAIFISYIALVELYFSLFHQGVYGTVIGLIYGSKMGYLLMVFFTLSLLIKTNSLSPLILLKHLRNYVAITAVSLIISFLTGVGFNTYGEGTFGVKGFFPAGNGLGVFMGVGTLLSIYYWRLSKERFSLCFSLVILFGTLIIGSKTALLLGLIGVLSIIALSGNVIFTVLSMVSAFMILGFYYDELISLFSVVYDVILFRFENSDSIFSWIFSNRDIYFLDAMRVVSFDGIFIARFIIGFGAYISFRNPYDYHSSIDVLESDIADLFFMYGIIAALIYISFIVIGLYKGLVANNYFLSFCFFLLMGHSFIAGHVIFNGMSGVLVPILFLLLSVRRFKAI